MRDQLPLLCDILEGINLKGFVQIKAIARA